MYAIIETGGKQYRVHEGMVLKHELVQGVDIGQSVRFDKVLLVARDDNVQIGAPYVDGAAVTGEIQDQSRDDKVIVYKYKSKKGYRRKQGHRQSYMSTQITGIEC